MTTVVTLDQVSRTFEGPSPVEALKPTDLEIERGDYLALVGPSGSGKSTLLHLLGLLDRPTGGTYYLDGIDTSTLSEAERAGLRASNIGFVFQAFHLLAHRTNVENVMLADVYRRGGRDARRERAVEALEKVGLGHRLDGNPTTLSGGERQRVAVARALVSSPSLLLADEPTGNLDTVTGDQIMTLFSELHSQGLTVAVITHDDAVAARAQRIVRIRDGVVEADAAPQFRDGAVEADAAPQFRDGAVEADAAPQFRDGVVGADAAPQFRDGVVGADAAPQFRDGAVEADAAPPLRDGAVDADAPPQHGGRPPTIWSASP